MYCNKPNHLYSNGEKLLQQLNCEGVEIKYLLLCNKLNNTITTKISLVVTFDATTS